MGMLLSLPMALVGLAAMWIAARGWTRPRPALAEAGV
jgi:prolipoprotein diacylglyceryltransferase